MGTMRRSRKWIYFVLLLAAVLVARQAGSFHSHPERTLVGVAIAVHDDEKPLQVLQVVSSMKVQVATVPKPYPTEWREDLRLDHLCDLIKQLAEVSAAERAQALMDSPGNVKTIDAKIKAIYLETIAGHSAVPLRSQGLTELDFYNALAASNLLSGPYTQNPSANLSAANQLLQVLMINDPGNGAYAFFRAKVGSMIHPDLKLYPKELFLKAFQAPRFDTFYLEMLKRMREKSFTNSSYMMMSLTLTTTLPVPNYYESLKLIRTYIEEGDAEFNREAFKFGERLIKPALKANLDLNNINWSILEYGVGKAIAKAAWHALHPGSDTPELYSDHHFITQDETLDHLGDDYSDLTVDHCDRRGFDRLFEKARLKEVFNQ